MQVWPGALLLSKIMMEDMDEVLGAMATVSQDEGSEENTTPTPEGRVQSNTYSSEGGLQKWFWEDMAVVELGCGLALCSVVAAR